jgi:GT2 family glycosyltransferase
VQISVVIPTFNRSHSLEVVLPSLLQQSLAADQYEILLCDAGSTDGTEALVERLNSPQLRLLRGEDRGRAGARNRGIQAAQAKLVLFTDADIIADQNLLLSHLDRHYRFADQAVVGCEIQVDSLEQYREFSLHPAAHARHKPTRKVLPWHYFLTGNASVQKQTLVDVGMFDEKFSGYGHEDLELGYRLIKAGLTIFYAPEAIDYHWHPVPLDEQYSKMFLAGRSTVRFYRKYRDPRIALRMGLNPLALAWHSLIRKEGWIYRQLQSRTDRPGPAREILLQHHYLSGVKQALREK